MLMISSAVVFSIAIIAGRLLCASVAPTSIFIWTGPANRHEAFARKKQGTPTNAWLLDYLLSVSMTSLTFSACFLWSLSMFGHQNPPVGHVLHLDRTNVTLKFPEPSISVWLGRQLYYLTSELHDEWQGCPCSKYSTKHSKECYVSS